MVGILEYPCPSLNLVYATSHLSLVAFYSYLVTWLAMLWACTYYTDFTDGWFLWELLPFSCLFDHTSIHTSCVRNWSFVFCCILFIFVILVDHDLSMRILYRFHGWLIFVRVIALFMFVWPYVCPHILCTQLVICLLSHFIHNWYLGWPWSEHVYIIPISRMVDFCESYCPFHVPLRAAAINYFLN